MPNYLQEINKFKMKLLASISHDLKTPLNASCTFLQILLENVELDEETKRKNLIPILYNMMLLKSTINDICDFSSIEIGDFALEFSPFSLRDLFQEVYFYF